MFLIIDGSSLLTTHYYASLPPEMKNLREESQRALFYEMLSRGENSKYNGALKGALKAIMDIIRMQKPEYIAVVLDSNRNTFRKDFYPEYKAQRDEKPEPLKEQFRSFEDILNSWGINVLIHTRYEADDFAGSLVKKFEQVEPCVVYSKDKDYFQLVSMNTTMWKPFVVQEDDYYPATKDCPKNTRILRCSDFYDSKTPVKSDHFVDYLALVGDTADNVPGCAYVGQKSAATLIALYGTLENIYKEIDNRLLNGEYDELVAEWKNEGLRSNTLTALMYGRENAFLSKMLVTIKTDLPITADLEDFKTKIVRNEYYKTIKEYSLGEVLG